MVFPVSIRGIRIGICAPIRQGFVLAEALVVAVIVAALATVAIPIYTGMIRNQRVEACRNIAQTAAFSANVYYRKYNREPDCTESSSPNCVSRLGIFLPDPSKYTITIQGTHPNEVVLVTDISKGAADTTVRARAGYH